MSTPSEEIEQHRREEIEEVSIPVPANGSKFKASMSRSKSGLGKVIYRTGQKETHVIILGQPFPWEVKAPYVLSGKSTLGALEYDQANDELKCHICGAWRKSLGLHIVGKHKINLSDYRKNAGLTNKASLCCLSLKHKHSTNGRIYGRSNLIPIKSGFQPALKEMRIRGLTAHRNAKFRQAKGMGFSRNPEAANLRGHCKSQLSTRILDLCKRLSKTPSVDELSNAGIGRRVIEGVFGLPLRMVMQELGLTPNKASRPKSKFA